MDDLFGKDWNILKKHPEPDTLFSVYRPVEPFEFDKTAAASRFMAVLERRVPNANGAPDRVRRLLRLPKREREDDAANLVLAELRNRGNIHHPAIEARMLATNGRWVDVFALDAAFKQWINPDADLNPFYDAIKHDDTLWALIEPCYGLRNFRAGSLFEALTMTIIEQQIALVTAQRAERWLIEMFGDGIVYNDEAYYVFPTPERIAELTVDDLRPLKITGRRINVILDIARAVVDGSLDLEALATSSKLTDIKGVGNWTAAWATIRALGVYPYMGSADVALRAAVNRYVYGLSGRADRDVTDEWFARYGEHAGIASFYTLMRYAFEMYP